MIALPVPKEHIVEPLRQALRPLQIVLFGSFARGTAGPDSDLDLLVVCRDGTDLRQAHVAALGAMRRLGWPKDVVVTTPEGVRQARRLHNSVVRDALDEGVSLYESLSHA